MSTCIAYVLNLMYMYIKCNEHGNWKIDFMEKGCVNLQKNIPKSLNVRAVNVPAVL